MNRQKTANGIYQERAKNINKMIEQLQYLLSEHAEGQAENIKNFAYCGDLAHVEEQLGEAIRFLGNG